MAWYLRSRPIFAEPPADSPSTTNNSQREGSRAGQAARVHGRFAAGQLTGFARSFTRTRGFNALADNAAGHRGMLIEPIAQALVDQLLDIALDIAVELAFSLPFKLRLRQAHADDRHEPFANVVTADADFVLLLFQHAGGRREIVDGARQGGAEAGEMRAAVDGVDRIRK